MTFISKNTLVVYLTQEVTEGVAVEPTLGSEAVGVLSDGFELNLNKETVERTNLTSSIATSLPRAGMKTAEGSISVEGKAGSTAGSAPDAGLLFLSALGGVKTLATTLTSTTNTTSNIGLSAGDVTNLALHDIVMVKSATGFHVSPISAVGTNSVTLMIPMSLAPADATVIEKFTKYYGTDSGHPTLTITGFMEDSHKQQATGCMVSSMALESFETGQVSSFAFGVQGQNYTETLAASGLTASYGDAEPPIILDACVYKDGVEIAVNSVSFSVENTIGRVMSTCSPNGIIGQKTTKRAITGSFNPYMDSADVSLFEGFTTNTTFSLFLSFANPVPGVAGAKKNVVACYLPNCIITSMPKADSDGIMQYNVEFAAGASPTGVGSDVYVAFI